MLARFQLPQYPIIARTKAHVVHASYSSDVIDVSCKKRRCCVLFPLSEFLTFTTISIPDLFLMFLTPCYLRTYNVVHGGLIAAAQMRAVETDHNQTTVERLEETEMKAARLILGQILCHRDEHLGNNKTIFCFHEIIKNKYLSKNKFGLQKHYLHSFQEKK